jgi:uncharacterized protein (DUF305 family)
MPPLSRSGVLSCLAAVVLLSGCSSSSSDAARELDPDVTHLQAGAPGEPGVVLTEAPAEELVLGSPFVEADVAFMRDMQVHHEQALAMTAMVEARTEREDLRLFTQRMDISQTGELEQLERLLAEHEQAVERTGEHGGAHSGHSGDGDHSDMPGMLTDAELAALEAASGDDFVRLFLQAMTKHHDGALAMVAEVLATEGALADQRLYEFAQHVDSDQRIELDRMARIWESLPPV